MKSVMMETEIAEMVAQTFARLNQVGPVLASSSD